MLARGRNPSRPSASCSRQSSAIARIFGTTSSFQWPATSRAPTRPRSGPTSRFSPRAPDLRRSPWLGSPRAAAVDSSGALKTEGTYVRADVRIWSAADCAGEASLGYRSTRWLNADRGTAIGLTVDDGFRANAGIVNADAAPHTWRTRSTSLIDGSSYDSEITVAAASSAIVGLAPGTEGPISITIESTSPDLSWTGWAASVDNRSGDPWYSSLSPD